MLCKKPVEKYVEILFTAQFFLWIKITGSFSTTAPTGNQQTF